jgi:hypothetical protein
MTVRDRAVAHIRRGLVVAEIRRAAGVDMRPEIRDQMRSVLQRAQIIALRRMAAETIAALEAETKRTGSRKRALRRLLLNALFIPSVNP